MTSTPLVKIVAVQAQMGKRLSLEAKIHIFKQRPDFVCFPEYYLLDPDITDYQRAAVRQSDYLDYLNRLSDELQTCIVGGTVVEATHAALYNSAYLFDRGRELGVYRKRYPVPGELAKGIASGSANLVVEVDAVRVGMMICGDVFYPHLYDELRDERADIIFIPTTSLYRPDDSLSQKRRRDEKYFLSGASRAGAYVVKVCGVGQIFGRALQGRSLIAAPWGILQQTSMFEESQERMLTATLDIAEVREFGRKLQAGKTRSIPNVV